MDLSQNPNVTMEYVEVHPETQWDWCGLSLNPNVTMEYVEAHPKLPWVWEGLSMNEYKKHPFFKRLPKVSPQQKLLLEELHHVFDIPPEQPNVKPVFQKGGHGFWESWSCLQNAL